MKRNYDFTDYGGNEFKPENDRCFCCGKQEKNCICDMNDLITAEILKEQEKNK